MKKLALLLVLVPFTAAADKNYQSGKGGTWNCAKDPVVNINHGRGKYTFKGACDAINVNGGQSTLTIESVDTLNVNAAKNTIKIGTVDTINVNGADNTITYKKSKDEGGATVTNVGTGNKIGPAK
ncbi:MAG: DUF3060 domain-containing protein [Myxococcota bacterium]|nr:DUF3060 domain-containing protein [Myxococcota bacterium]